MCIFKPKRLQNALQNSSTNCTLNSFACYNHLDKYDIHPYAFDIAGIVRSGDMSREEGLEKLHKDMDILVQVNIGEDPQKSGVSITDTEELLYELKSIPRVKVCGLMTMPPMVGYYMIPAYLGI